MDGIYNNELRLISRNVDFAGRWRPDDIFYAMQESAATHSDILGCGYEALIGRGMAWALMRTYLEMDIYPMIGTKISLKTWPGPARRGIYPRYFVFEDQDGARLGAASSLWLVLDLKSRSMADPAASGVKFDTPDIQPSVGLPGKSAAVLDGTFWRRRAEYTDLDVNGHVNNTKYISWLLDAVGTEALTSSVVRTLNINYSKEILPLSDIDIRFSAGKDGFRMEGEVDGHSCFSISGELSEV